jgi:hypothetical protein
VDAAPVRRRWPIIAAATTGVAILLLVVWSLTPWATDESGDKIADRQQRVSIVLPEGWINGTEENAGQIATEDSDDEVEPYRVPDLAALSWDSAKAVPGPQQVRIAVLTAPDDTSLDRLHPEHQAAVCAEMASCTYGWRPATRLLVDQHQAIAQFVLPAATAEVVWAVTVSDGRWVVRFTGISSDWQDSKDGGQLATVLNTLQMPA